MHSIKVASQMTGLSPDILRAWERRYSAVKPRRDAKGQRLYNARDLARLRLLGKVVAYGHQINRAANLSIAELERLLEETGEHEPGRHYATLIRRVLEAAAAYRPDLCDETLGLAMATLLPHDAVRYVFAPLLHEVGARWQQGVLSMGQEHLLIACIERLLMGTINLYHKVASGPRIVYSTLSGERHSLGALMAAFLAATHGIRCCHLGIDLPLPELARAVEKSESVVLGLSLISLSNVDDAVAQLIELSALVPDGIALWLGGPAVNDLAMDDIPRRYTLIRSFQEYILQLEMLQHTAAP